MDWYVRRRGKFKMIPRTLSGATRRIELTFIEMGEIAEGAVL